VFRGDTIFVRTDSLCHKETVQMRTKERDLYSAPVPASQLLRSQVLFDLVVRYEAHARFSDSP